MKLNHMIRWYIYYI